MVEGQIETEIEKFLRSERYGEGEKIADRERDGGKGREGKKEKALSSRCVAVSVMRAL